MISLELIQALGDFVREALTGKKSAQEAPAR